MSCATGKPNSQCSHLKRTAQGNAFIAARTLKWSCASETYSTKRSSPSPALKRNCSRRLEAVRQNQNKPPPSSQSRPNLHHTTSPPNFPTTVTLTSNRPATSKNHTLPAPQESRPQQRAPERAP